MIRPLGNPSGSYDEGMIHRVGIVFLVVSLALCGLGLWGFLTDSGRRQFDEMAGIIPLVALVLGLFLALAGGGLVMLGSRKKVERAGFEVLSSERKDFPKRP